MGKAGGEGRPPTQGRRMAVGSRAPILLGTPGDSVGLALERHMETGVFTHQSLVAEGSRLGALTPRALPTCHVLCETPQILSKTPKGS